MRVSIMVSGGLDSYIAYYYALKNGYIPDAIWVNLGQPYWKKEEEKVNSFEFPVKKIKIDLLREEFGNLPTPQKQIIPGRNLFLAYIGAFFNERVWIVALETEMHTYARERDKSWKFYRDTTELFTYIFNYVRENTIVETPFSHLSKTEIVRWALENGITEKQLKNTSSCYDDKIERCGKCLTCFKRWIAMINNNIEEKYISLPYESEYAKRTVKEMVEAVEKQDFSHYTKKRCIETFEALIKIGKVEYKEVLEKIKL